MIIQYQKEGMLGSHYYVRRHAPRLTTSRHEQEYSSSTCCKPLDHLTITTLQFLLANPYVLYVQLNCCDLGVL